ncbi:unnamed protein product [Rotaria socialis]|uniref:DAGKc domain-containing protein n=1 Tax=Rotaria socialis TaxID=392032 RepID=A0A817S5J3_9BILA|nr:unnamed protein product [Rotaria socialis]CAF3517425.1 unnamed protein product [Rotaria socialis]CAF3775308.1 unnamed protein product [Rotaria socialis]CAF4287622.1 unnamed protein product [Rotaria socialis]CAF4429609.1 unnamed protein product [Rotaria socialis]
MSSKAQRRRAKPSVTVKQAFEENENENKLNTHVISDGYESSPMGNIDLDRFYERAFFTINDSTVEVVLNNDILSWSTISNVSSETSREQAHQRQAPNHEYLNSIHLHDVYAISPMYHGSHRSLNINENQSDISLSNTTSSLSSSSNLPLRGFQLHSFDKMNENILQEILVIFQSNTPNQIEQWYRLLSKLISEHRPPRNFLVICNPYAGSRQSRYVYSTKIKPMLENAHHSFTYSEIDDFYSADEALNDFQGDFDSLDGLVIIGGDGSVINITNALLRYLAKQNRTRLNAEDDLPQLTFPICIVPNGTTNIVCHSIHGCTDHHTSILHLLFNKRMKIDMSAIFDINYNFVTANFSAGAGFPANALKYFTRYSLCSPNKTIRKSFAKAASNKNLRFIEMEIRYILADQNSITMTRCHRGCSSCTPPSIEVYDNQVKVFDSTHIQNINKRKMPSLSNNNHSTHSLSASRKSYSQENEEKKQWKTLRGNYLQVAVLTNANLWSFAPQGLSKFGHIADGLLDLVLIESTTRKEFLRYIKRNGNSKNQYELPFTRVIKVKEIEIELKFPNNYLINGISNTNNELDSSSSEDSSNEEYFNNENRGSFTQRHEPHPPNVPISEDSRRYRRPHHHHINEQAQESLKQKNYSETEWNNGKMNSYSTNVLPRRKSFLFSLKLKKDKTTLPHPSSFDVGKYGDDKQNQKIQRLPSGSLRSAKSLLNLFTSGNSSSVKLNQSLNPMQESSHTRTKTSIGRRSSIISRSLSKENEKIPTSTNTQYRNSKQPCMWNLDFTPYNSPLIRIKCFYRFLPVFGVGQDRDTTMREINYSCFGRIG